MPILADEDIARRAQLKDIRVVAQQVGLTEDDLDLYGKYKAKINVKNSELSQKKSGKIILVTAINPTPAGEGKTTVTIGLSDALNTLGKKSIATIREPSLGPVFGLKGGAAGGGYAQVVPMEDINFHFTGDLHAITSANNLLAAMLDNHIYHGNELNIDIKRVLWRRVIDMNDRQLRQVIGGLGKKTNGIPYEGGFDITVASEVMAIFCLAEDLMDLKARLSEIIVAYNRSGEPVRAKDLKAEGAMCALLRDAFKPNIVQTLGGFPTLIHGGPFANIAHGCCSVVATKTASYLADYVVTEAGFGADLGAEKFVDIKCRVADIEPAAVVIVATVRALKFNGGVKKDDLNQENLAALKMGVPNLLKHIENIKDVMGLSCVVAINHFPNDTAAELAYLKEAVSALGVEVVLCEVWAKGGEGGLDLAKAVLALSEERKTPQFLYQMEDSIEEKIEAVAQKFYGADGVDFTLEAQKTLREIQKLGYDHFPICMAKTPFSFTDNPQFLGRPTGFRITVRDLSISAGAGFIVVLTGDIMRMPGLPKHPIAEAIDVDGDGLIHGLS